MSSLSGPDETSKPEEATHVRHGKKFCSLATACCSLIHVSVIALEKSLVQKREQGRVNRIPMMAQNKGCYRFLNAA